MEKYGENDELTIKILNRLVSNIPPSCVQLGISSKELNAKLFEMKDKDLIDFKLIEDHPTFKGEPKETRLKPKGREVAEKYKHVGI